jgi:hypothetical protein
MKDAIYCFDRGADEVNDGHKHYFNKLLDTIEELLE